MASLTQWIWVCVDSGSWWWTGRLGVLQFMGSQSWTQLSDWTELNWTVSVECISAVHQSNSIHNTYVLEKAMAPHSSTLAWKIPWMEQPGRLQSMGSLPVWHEWVTSLSLLHIGEGNGNPLQCSCLENPRDGGVWWASVYGVAQSWTRLKWLSS